MIIKEGFVLRELGGQYVVVAIGEASKHFNGVIHLNETGAFLFKLLSKETTKEKMVKALLDEYDVTEDNAIEDVLSFINKLKEANLLNE